MNKSVNQAVQAASDFFQPWKSGRGHEHRSSAESDAAHAACDPHCTAPGARLYRIRLSVKEKAAPELRRFVMSLCGETLAFMRFAAIPVEGRIAVCLCLNRAASAQDLQLALGALPNVELIEAGR